MSLLQVISAGFSYPRQPQKVFNNISFDLSQGEIFCLLGPNGCGKTTLLDCILGVNRLNSGQIMVQGQDSSGFRPGQIARHIAYVPQRHEHTFPYSVMDIVKMGRTAYTGRFESPSAEDKRIAKEALGMVGLMHLRHRPYTQLSGGESQLVMIARALAQRTAIIIMDEPTSHLDFKHEMVVMETIVHLVKNNGLAVMMATHFPNHVFYFENQQIPVKVALMHNKEFLAVGSSSQVLTEGNMQTLYNINTRLVDYPLDQDRQLRQLIPISTYRTEEQSDA